ncbi:hypothetical protein BDV06DRAFT_196212 [Aspergillus oleicola]
MLHCPSAPLVGHTILLFCRWPTLSMSGIPSLRGLWQPRRSHPNRGGITNPPPFMLYRASKTCCSRGRQVQNQQPLS